MPDKDMSEKKLQLAKNLCHIPGIVCDDDKRKEAILQNGISLKTLFERQHMDEYHVDCLVLYRIAMQVLKILEGILKEDVCPGLYDLKDFYTDVHGGYPVFLLHPERFQFLDMEQDYEWYPEDERIFGNRILFDKADQKMADTRLLFKILTAASRGNIGIPPRESRKDYAALFYKTLPPELKSLFFKDGGAGHEEFKELLSDLIELEKNSARKVREVYRKKAEEQSLSDTRTPSASEKIQTDGSCLYSIFILLRTETSQSGMISEMLYRQQDLLELETRLSRQESRQAFVYGDGFVEARDFCLYPAGFRVQLRPKIRDYSSAEAIIIGCELADKLSFTKKDNIRIYLITDGRLKYDAVFRQAGNRLKELKEDGCDLRFIYNPDCSCEACEQLKRMAG